MISALSRHTRSIWFMVFLLTLGGIAGALKLPVALFPHINYPRVLVAIDAGDRDPETMAAVITVPLEIVLRAVPGVIRIRSTTSRGAAEVALSFDWGEDMVAATLATQAALATFVRDAPPGTQFSVRRSDPTIFPALGIALTSRTLDQQALRQIADLKIRPALSAVTGVAGVDIVGGSPREFAVDVDTGKAAALGLGLTDIAAALAKSNEVRGLGRFEDRHRLYLVLVENQLASAADIAATPIKAAGRYNSDVVTLGQVASIHASAQPSFVRVTSNGADAVLVNIRQALTGDTVKIVRDVNARLREADLPPSVVVTTFYDQSELVSGAASAVRDAIFLSAVLAGLVLFAFLRSGRLMLITGAVLPAVLAATCLVLFAFGMSFNMMTLGGMAAAVGLIVDDAVVMLEHIMRRLQQLSAVTAQNVLSAASEMARPLIGSTLATIVVFTPLAFINGVSGELFKALAVTMVASLSFSLLYALLAIPLASAHWLRARDAESVARARGLMARLNLAYERAGNRVFARPTLFVIVVGGAIALAGGVAWTQVTSGFMPAMDEGGFILDYKAAPGASLSDTDRILRQVEKIIVATPEVSSYSRRTGVQLGGGLTEADEGDFFIRLKGGSRRDIESVMADIRTKVQEDVPGISVETAQLMEDLIGDLTAVPQPIEVKLFGDDAASLQRSAKRLGESIAKIPGIVEVVDGLRVAGDAVRIVVDPGAATQQGLDPAAVASQLEALIGGINATQIRFGAQLVGVRVRGLADVRSRASQLEQMSLIAPDGHPVRLGQIARVSIAAGQKQLTREDLAPFVGVTARLEGLDLGSGMKQVRRAVTQLQLPASIRVEYGGLYSQQQQSFAALATVFAAALLLSALLLTVMFERITWTLAALATVLLCAAAVFCGLWATGIELDVSALMGLTMVVGMVTELVIFYLAEIDVSLPVLQALRAAGTMRMRPILMSALIAVLTLSPLALGVSRGAGLQQPLATAIIFGLSAAVPLVLLFLPALIRVISHGDRTHVTS